MSKCKDCGPGKTPKEVEKVVSRENVIDLKEKTLIELEADLLRQEHRIWHLTKNYFWTCKTFEPGDCRRDAITNAFILRLIIALLPLLTMGGLGWAVGWISLSLAWSANSLLEDQNKLIVKQNEYFETQNELSKHQLAIAREAEARSKLPEWLEIETINVAGSDKGDSFKIDVVVKNNSGKTCVTDHAVVTAQLTSPSLPDRAATSADLRSYDGGTFPLKLSNEVAEHKLRILKKLKDGDSFVLSYYAVRPLLPNIPDTPDETTDSYSWDIKITIVGSNNLAEFKPVICRFQQKLTMPSEVDPSIIEAITRP